MGLPSRVTVPLTGTGFLPPRPQPAAARARPATATPRTHTCRCIDIAPSPFEGVERTGNLPWRPRGATEGLPRPGSGLKTGAADRLAVVTAAEKLVRLV